MFQLHCCHASPHLDLPSSKLNCGHNTVWVVLFSLPSPHNTFLPGINSKVDSFENNTCPHCSDVKSFLSPLRCPSNCKHLFLCAAVQRGFLAATHPLNPHFSSFLLTVLVDTSTQLASSKSLLRVLDVALLSERARRKSSQS